VMTGRFFTAEEAWQGGMVARLVDEGRHMEGAEELARQLLEVPQGTLRSTVRARRLVRQRLSVPYQEVVGKFSWAQSEEARQAVTSHAANRRRGR